MTIVDQKILAARLRATAFDLPPSKSLGALISAYHEADLVEPYQLEELIKVWERVRTSEAINKGHKE